jgi:fatty-acyl-CoA synthase
VELDKGVRVMAVVTCHYLPSSTKRRCANLVRQKRARSKTPHHRPFFAESDLQLTGSAKVKTADLRSLAARTLEAEAAA